MVDTLNNHELSYYSIVQRAATNVEQAVRSWTRKFGRGSKGPFHIFTSLLNFRASQATEKHGISLNVLCIQPFLCLSVFFRGFFLPYL